jgi:UDP-4-amino-4,6-dideoxy-N-acetyl-beta-L-altrosamine transaminase
MDEFIPYGRQSIDEEDLAAVREVLTSDFLTTGPAVAAFEEAVAGAVGAAHGVAISNGTAALHAAYHALGVGPGDEVIVPPMTFAATANAALYCGATPVFADVAPDTLLLDPAAAAAAVTPRTKVITGVDYAGQPCDWPRLRALADEHGLALVADGCHALGATLGGRAVGTLADLTVFSFHPVKHITTGEGGMIMTDRADLAEAMRVFRTHGITADAAAREAGGTWFYEMRALGYNYRITDIQCALGVSQMRRMIPWLARRRALAGAYDDAFADTPAVRPLGRRPGLEHAWHLYVVRVDDRRRIFEGMRAAGIGVNVHYVPVHLHPYYRERLGTAPGLCPVAEAAYEELLSLPMHQALTDAQQARVVETLRGLTG